MTPHQGFAEIGGTRLFYELTGAGPPLVLIHAFSLDTRMWDSQVDSFAERYRVLRYDLRGFGRSALPGPEAYAHAEDLHALLKHLGIGPAAIVGMSLGGQFALDFALAYPAMASALVLVDAVIGGYQMTPEWDASVTPVWQGGRDAGVEVARARWMAHPLFAPALANPSSANLLRHMIEDYSGWHWVHHDPARHPHPPAAEQLKRITAPVLAVVGELDLPDFHAIAKLVCAQAPAARHAVLPGVGHMANMEAPEAFNALVLEFLVSLFS